MARSEELIKKIYNAAQEIYDNNVTLEAQKRRMKEEMNPGAFSDFYYGYVKLRTGQICKRCICFVACLWHAGNRASSRIPTLRLTPCMGLLI